MALALSVGWAFFPLDEELGLLSGGLTPRGEERLARLASWMPFEQAREVFQDLVGVRVSKATARRVTLATEEAALVETHRRGLERATAVCAVQDGAEWLQGLVDYHRADAVRILDFAHAAEYVNEMGQAVRGAGGRLPATWLDGVLHHFRHQGPARVLRHVSWLAARSPSADIQEKLTYLQKREAGMRWGRQNVNRMLVLRNAVCNRRWHETWARSVAHQQALRTNRRQGESQQRRTSALWFLVFCGVRVFRLSHPPVPTSTSLTAPALAEQPTHRPGAGYSWRNPFLRRPPSTSTGP